MTVTFGTAFQHTGSSLLVSAAGDLDAAAEPSLARTLDRVPARTAVVIFDMHRVPFMDSAGLLLFLDLHLRAECLGLRVLVVGWQAQPRQVMEALADLPSGGSGYPRERAALIGFRRMVEERSERQRQFGRKPAAVSGPQAQPLRHGDR